MELSPKQQTVEQIKKASRILIIGHRKPEGDLLGSALALCATLKELGKSVDVVVSDDIPAIYSYLPYLNEVKKDYKHTPGKVIRIDTKRFPAKGMKWQKEGDFLDIFLDSDKNLKFEYIEIINGLPKPDLIIVLDTPGVSKIDRVYDGNTELFFEVPVVNIDHHSGNEYFGSINLVDLTATSTAEILVSLFEALGVKINNPDTATCLLTGIVNDTQSFRSGATTPKSLTVAAQLLAAGGRQQEIISNLYKKRPMLLLNLWRKLVTAMEEDNKFKIAWTKVRMSEVGEGITLEDVFEAADELIGMNADTEIILIIAELEEGDYAAKLKGAKGVDVLTLANLFDGGGTSTDAIFKIKGPSIRDVEMNILKRIFDHWSETKGMATAGLWEVIPQSKTEQKEEIEEKLTSPETLAEFQAASDLTIPQTPIEVESTQVSPSPVAEDPIENALKSLNTAPATGGFTSLKDVIEKKKKEMGASGSEDIDVFDEDND